MLMARQSNYRQRKTRCTYYLKTTEKFLLWWGPWFSYFERGPWNCYFEGGELLDSWHVKSVLDNFVQESKVQCSCHFQKTPSPWVKVIRLWRETNQTFFLGSLCDLLTHYITASPIWNSKQFKTIPRIAGRHFMCSLKFGWTKLDVGLSSVDR